MSDNSGSSNDLTEAAIAPGTADHDDVIVRSADYDDVMLRSRGHFISGSSKENGNSFFDSSTSESILECLHRDIIACDVQLSLFVGAAISYRHDSSLSPFPPFYLDSAGNKDAKGIQEAIHAFPTLVDLKNQLEKRKCKLTPKQLNLLRWIFEGSQSLLKLRTLKQSSYSDTLKSIGIQLKQNHPKPNFILEVSKKDTESWQERCEKEETFHGFHGSRLDNWFSILNHGLQQHRSKTSKFGEGIYLSSDLVLSLNYSTSGVGWSKSLLGSTLSCLSINQVINHQNVKIHSDCPKRGIVEDSEGGSIPEHHILVRDNQLVHARYLMVYCGKGTKSADDQRQVQGNRLVSFVSSNKVLVVLLCYGLLLLIVGLSNSPWVIRFMAKNWK